MLWIFPYLSVLKGNLSRSLGAIAYTEWFPNKLPCIFSREILKVVKKAIAPGSCFPNALLHFFSREILKVENRRSHGS
jgi:hypothetical protein